MTTDAVPKAAEPKGSTMRVGETWAYRARRKDCAAEVEVLKIGTKAPSRVLVQFLADEFEGHREWVPHARLKAPWAHVDDFVAREQRWDAVATPGLSADDPRGYAAEIVFSELIPNELATFGYGTRGGITTIVDVDALAALVAVEPKELRFQPSSFVDGGLLIVPWDTTLLVATAAARGTPQSILTWVDSAAREAFRDSIHGSYLGARTSHFMDPEACIAFDEKHGKPVRDTLLKWCGADASGQFDERRVLRDEARRIRRIARDAIDLLSQTNTRAARRLRIDLDSPTRRA